MWTLWTSALVSRGFVWQFHVHCVNLMLAISFFIVRKTDLKDKLIKYFPNFDIFYLNLIRIMFFHLFLYYDSKLYIKYCTFMIYYYCNDTINYKIKQYYVVQQSMRYFLKSFLKLGHLPFDFWLWINGMRILVIKMLHEIIAWIFKIKLYFEREWNILKRNFFQHHLVYESNIKLIKKIILILRKLY